MLQEGSKPIVKKYPSASYYYIQGTIATLRATSEAAAVRQASRIGSDYIKQGKG